MSEYHQKIVHHAFGIKIKNMKVIKMVSMEKVLAFFIEISSLFSRLCKQQKIKKTTKYSLKLVEKT